MTDATLQLPPVFDYQQEAIFGPQRYAVIEGSTKCGKTQPCLSWLLSECGRVGGHGRAFWWVAPTHEQAEIAYNRTRRMLQQADPEGTIWEAKDHRKIITIAGSGVLSYKTGEEPDNLYGDDVYAAVMDEFTRQREEAWHALRSTLTATGGRCRFIGNVKGRRNWGWKLARLAQSGERGMGYRKLTCEDAIGAGIMDRQEVEDAKAMLPHAVFRELYYAEASEDGSNPFGIEHIRANIAEMSTGKPVCFGVDIARKVDWTVVVGLDASGSVCRFERWHGASWQHSTERILGIVGNTPTLVDATGVGDAIAETLNRRRPTIEGFLFTNRSKQNLMEGLALAIQSRKVSYPAGVIVDELESFEYEYKPRSTLVSYSAPTGLHDDCVCALALAQKQMTDSAHAPQFYVGVVSGPQGDRFDSDRRWQ